MSLMAASRRWIARRWRLEDVRLTADKLTTSSAQIFHRGSDSDSVHDFWINAPRFHCPQFNCTGESTGSRSDVSGEDGRFIQQTVSYVTSNIRVQEVFTRLNCTVF